MSRFLDEKYKKLTPYVPGEQPKEKKIIKLNTNENPYPPSAKVIQAIKEDEEKRLYPDPSTGEAVLAVANYYGLSNENVILGNGSDEILAFAFMAYGKKVFYPEISYGFYPVFKDLFLSQGRPIPLKKDLSIEVKDYYNLGGTIVIANPNAPTGMILSLEEIEKLLTNNRDNVVIIDEAYVDFGAKSAVELIPKYENLLVVQTFSKSRSLAGTRIGMAMGQKDLISDMNKIKHSFNPYSLSREAIVSAKVAMEDKEYFNLTAGKIIETREFFVKELERMGFEVLPSFANFIFVKTGKRYFEKLREKGIIVRHFDKDPVKDYIRITIGKKEDMERVVEIMEELLCEQLR